MDRETTGGCTSDTTMERETTGGCISETTMERETTGRETTVVVTTGPPPEAEVLEDVEKLDCDVLWTCL